MHSLKTITVEHGKIHPVPTSRSSIKVSRRPSLNDSDDQGSSQSSSSSRDTQSLYTNVDSPNSTRIPSKTLTTINIGSYPRDRTQNINLVMNGNSNGSIQTDRVLNEVELRKASIHNSLDLWADAQLSALIDEYQTSINRGECENNSCYRFKLLSYRLTQSLIEKINYDRVSKISDHTDKANLNGLKELVNEKDSRIKELEKMLEDQKRLRLQDANQVEEKATKIKEWVANKLKELENQNKQLRDHNKKQKQTVESLNQRIAMMSPALSPRRSHRKDVGESDCDLKPAHRNIRNESDLELNTEKMISPPRSHKCESPIYDSVSVEQVSKGYQQEKTRSDDKPPPPPQHRVDAWEVKLYSLADKNFSQLLKLSSEDNSISRRESNPDSDPEANNSRKSSSSFKNDLISLMKPSYTTIDGDQVVDEVDLNSNHLHEAPNGLEPTTDHRPDALPPHPFQEQKNSTVQRPSLMSPIHRIRRNQFANSCDNLEQVTSTSLFSPRRTRNGVGDTILRTQSVRRNPAPGKLYDFINADLVKRGQLVKPGALKNHNRWFVLKDFHLNSYKSEADETVKATPHMRLRLDSVCQVSICNQSGDANFPFKLSYPDKTLQLIADSAQSREEWTRILTVAINMSDIDSEVLAKSESTHEGLMSFTRHGHTKRCHAILIKHVLFFLKSLSDPTPLGYISVKGAKIREITDNFDYDHDEHEMIKQKSCFQDCSLAIYPKFSLTLDPIYITLGCQQDINKWFFNLTIASGCDQCYGTPFERALIRMMITNSVVSKKKTPQIPLSSINSEHLRCLWKDSSVLQCSDSPIVTPLTSLPNETLRMEAIELFRSILLFTQVPLEPIAIDYHVSLLQNCLSRLLKYPEIRNEFYAQLIKQGTYILHRCSGSSSSTSSTCAGGSSTSSGCSPVNQRSSVDSVTASASDCHIVTDVDSIVGRARGFKLELPQNISSVMENDRGFPNDIQQSDPPSSNELLQVMQILAISVSLNLPRGRMRWWLLDYLGRFADPEKDIGKYALYTLKAIERADANGIRENVPSRTEIMSVLLRNPYDHSNPHSLPLSFPDGSYMVIGSDGSTTVDEFMDSMTKICHIRHSPMSDFYLFADDPSGTSELHILEPQRKILDIVGWWEQTLRKNNSGRYQNTRVIRLKCMKRLVLRTEKGETYQERLMIVHQVNQEVASQRIPLEKDLKLELAAIMAQLTFGDHERSNEQKLIKNRLERVASEFLGDPKLLDQCEDSRDKFLSKWEGLSGRSAQECVRVYLNCIRRFKVDEKSKFSVNANEYI